MTLEVSRFSGWLNAAAPCQVDQRKVHIKHAEMVWRQETAQTRNLMYLA